MSGGVILGLTFALVTSLTAVVSFLMKHRGAIASPSVELRRPIRTSLALFRSRWYTLGIIVAAGSWAFHVAALALAPISLVQTVIAAGLVFLTVVADKVFGLRVTRREVAGVVLTAAGLALLTGSLNGETSSAHNTFATGTLVSYVGIVLACAVVAMIIARRTTRGGPLLGAATGFLWGGSDICIKAVAGGLSEEPLGFLTDPLVIVVVVASLVGVAVSARSLQVGPAIAAIAFTIAAGNVSTVVAGPVVFGEPFPSSPLGVTTRVLAFGLVIVGAMMTPPPFADAVSTGAHP